MTTFIKARSLMLAVTSKLAWLPPTAARLTLAAVFVTSGWGKLNHLPKVIEFFTSLGIPAPAFHAHLVAGCEFFCGLAILIGLFTRLATIPLIISMIVAIVTAKRSELNDFDDIFGFAEYLYIVLMVWLAIDGPGPLSLDRFLTKRFKA